ncbi:MAG TPA: TetR/AcrR family transcriptional regulator [Plantibacter sp.]|uniref:TetR/AcrR family transcriptional regulator n=1 Tax=unclassified Plantibacter TaxID=2624265 RepID=UPI002B8C1EAC|nr:TetR/AcrR family transcriptional regulator [Plantibacter sp.]
MQERMIGQRPGGRSSRVLAAIHTAVGELVGAGVDRITFPVIAERAGVNPTTLYRRWNDVNALLEEVTVGALTRDGEAAPDVGTLEGDLAAWADAIVTDIARPERARYLRAMVGARTELVSHCAVTDRRREQARDVIDRAHDRGEAAPTEGQVIDHLISPLYYRVIFALPVDEEYGHRLVRDVLAMIRG